MPFYFPTWRNGEENIRGKLPVYGHMFNSFCGPNSLLPYIKLTSSEDCTIAGSTVPSVATVALLSVIFPPLFYLRNHLIYEQALFMVNGNFLIEVTLEI